MAKLLVINGPNLNLLGTREPQHYGRTTLAEIDARLTELAAGAGHTLENFQSNAEHGLVERIHRARDEDVAFIIINPAAFTHTSVALRDALAAVARDLEAPDLEVQLERPRDHRIAAPRTRPAVDDAVIAVLDRHGAHSGGASGLMDADCYYGRASEKPAVNYTITGGNGELDVRQPGTDNIHFGGRSQHNDWNLRFGNQLPLDLEIKMGAGTGRLQLSGLPLTHLRVEGGAGTLFVDLSGDWKQSIDGRISGGVGTVTVRLPAIVGVRVHATGGLGAVNAPGFQRDGNAYVNSAYGKSPVTLTLDIQGGIGTINLESGS